MELNIDITLSKYNCDLVALDNTEYSDELNKLVFVEFLCYYPYEKDEEDLLPITKSKRITDATSENYKLYRYSTEYDGRYVYNKYGIYNLDSLWDEVDEEYKTKNVIFYYKETNNIYLGNQNITSIEDLSNIEYAQLISNWYELRKYIGNEVVHYFISEVFTFCKLNKCVINYQKQTLFNKIQTCNKICKEDSQKSLRDFLFISLYVLDYLVCTHNYMEAQRILESLSSCGNLCEDTYITNNNCNCNYE